MKQISKNTCQSSTALGIWSMPRIQAELGRNAEMRWCSRGLSALGCWAGGPTRGWRPRQANGEKHGDQGTWEVHASPVCRCEGSAVAWQDQSGVRATGLGYEPQARGCKRDTLRRQDYAHPMPEVTNRDCKYGRPSRPASDLGHSPRLVAVT